MRKRRWFGGVWWGRVKEVIRRGCERDKKVVRRGSRIAILEPLKGGSRIVLLYIYICVCVCASARAETLLRA